MVGDMYNAGKYGAIVAFQFAKADIVASQTNVDLVLVGGGTLVVPPKSGSVVGISCRSTAAVTAGTFSVRAHKDSSEFAQSGYPNPSFDSIAGTSQESHASIRPGVLVFSADEGVGISYSSDATMAPTNTNDIDAVLFVQLDPN